MILIGMRVVVLNEFYLLNISSINLDINVWQEKKEIFFFKFRLRQLES